MSILTWIIPVSVVAVAGSVSFYFFKKLSMDNRIQDVENMVQKKKVKKMMKALDTGFIF